MVVLHEDGICVFVSVFFAYEMPSSLLFSSSLPHITKKKIKYDKNEGNEIRNGLRYGSREMDDY